MLKVVKFEAKFEAAASQTSYLTATHVCPVFRNSFQNQLSQTMRHDGELDACVQLRSISQSSLTLSAVFHASHFVQEAFCSRTFLSVFKQIIVLFLFGNSMQIAEMSVQVDPTVIRAVFGSMSIGKAATHFGVARTTLSSRLKDPFPVYTVI